MIPLTLVIKKFLFKDKKIQDVCGSELPSAGAVHSLCMGTFRLLCPHQMLEDLAVYERWVVHLWKLPMIRKAVLKFNPASVCVCSAMSDSLQPHGLQPARLLCPWDSPGKNPGVGCHALLQGIFLTQRSNSPLLWMWILYHWATWKTHFIPLLLPVSLRSKVGSSLEEL